MSEARRENVLGALEAVSHRLITVGNETYITAASVCELWGLIAAEAAGRLVTIFLDNARHKSDLDTLPAFNFQTFGKTQPTAKTAG